MKFQHRRGQHPSFWMQPSGPGGAEIDVIEWYGKKGSRQRLATNVSRHLADGGLQTTLEAAIHDPERYLANRSDHWWTEYHVFSVQWTPREYVFRIDGRETMRTAAGVSHQAEYLILSMLSSDYELGYLGGDQHLPQHAYVDWVKVWPQK
jgi:beta-glucanase (GH16 family)